MVFTLACKDFGVDCTYAARGETEEEVLQDGADHTKEVMVTPMRKLMPRNF